MAGLINPAASTDEYTLPGTLPAASTDEHTLPGTLCPLRSKTEIFPMPNEFGQIETLNASVVVPCDKRCMLYRREADGTHHCGLKP